MSATAGAMAAKANAAIAASVVRQSSQLTSQAASGDMVIGAMPIPAETSETASARCESNQPATVAISGAITAPPPMPSTMP